MTHYTHADLLLADRHVAEGEDHIVRQEELLSRLTTQGHPTADAEALLALLNATLVEHWAHRAAIAEALATGEQPRPAEQAVSA